MKVGDRPMLEVALVDQDGVAVDGTGATVTIRYRLNANPSRDLAAAAVGSPTLGVFEARMEAASDPVGLFEPGEVAWECHYSLGAAVLTTAETWRVLVEARLPAPS